MKVYQYDEVTGEYVSEKDARVCPGREAWDDNQAGKYLVPAHATVIAPPDATEGGVVCFVHGAWSQLEDHRGETWWTEQGDPVTIEGPGNPVDWGLLATAPDLPPVPVTVVTPRQIRLALSQVGLRAAVEDYVAAASQSVKDTWEFSTIIERNNPIIAAGAAELELSDEDIDSLFALAATL